VVGVSALCSFSAGWAAGRTSKHVSLTPKSSLPEQVARKTTKREPVNLENGHQNGDEGDNMIALWHTGWRGGATRKAFGLAISRSRVQILLEATLRNNLRQVVYTYVPLSPSSITWYRPKNGDALRLGR